MIPPSSAQAQQPPALSLPFLEQFDTSPTKANHATQAPREGDGCACGGRGYLPDSGQSLYYSHEKARKYPHVCSVPVEKTPLAGEALVYSSISHRSKSQGYINNHRVTHFELHRNTLKLHRTKKSFDKKYETATRGVIDSFSDKSRDRLRSVALNAMPELVSMFVGTYPAKYPSDGKEIKRHLDNFLKRFKRKYKTENYLWVLEFQGRGAPHFHIFFSLPYDKELHLFLAESWAEIVSGGTDDHSKVLRVHKSERQFVGWNMGSGQYVCKYLDKEQQKHVPDEYKNVGRFWGASRGIVPKPSFIVAQEMSLALMGQAPKSVQQAVRWICKWHEKHTNGHSRVRRSITNNSIPTGAPILKQILRYFRKQKIPDIATESPF